MSRLHRMLIVAVPSLFVGAIAASATLGQAQPRPAPAAKPQPKPRPAPVTVSVDDDLASEIRARVQAEIRRAMAEIDRNPDIPPKIRARVLKSLAKIEKSNLRDLSQLGATLGELRSELEGLTEDIIADEVPDIQREVERAMRSAGIDEADEPDEAEAPDDEDQGAGHDDPWARGPVTVIPPTPPVPPVPPVPAVGPSRPVAPRPPAPPSVAPGGFVALDDLEIDIDLDDVQVTPSQNRDLRRIASDERAASEPARTKIRALSAELRAAVDRVDVDEADVSRLVDAITSEEANVRKARLLALTRARKVLTAQQRAKFTR